MSFKLIFIYKNYKNYKLVLVLYTIMNKIKYHALSLGIRVKV